MTARAGAVPSNRRSETASSALLDAGARAAMLAAIEDRTFDLLVVGGGVTGAGVALDAAARGLTVLLVERDDFASGTSSRSSKLIHGGLRYLEQRNFTLVREALRERQLLLTRIAPHLVCPVRFLLPLERRWQRAYYGAGLAIYDGLGGRRPAVPRHRHLGRAATLRAAPALREDTVVGGIRYFDAQMDDARFVVALLRTAAARGATVASRIALTGFLGEGRVEGAVLADAETGAEREVRARATVLAAGLWSGRLEALAEVDRPVPIRASKGVHVLVPRDRLELRDALIVRAGRSVLLVLPWGAYWLIGTTDTDVPIDEAPPVATADDIGYLLDHVNRVLRRPLSQADVTGAFAGLRPLVDAGEGDTASIAREHVVRVPRPGLVTITGGKYTTYRLMAAGAVDAALREMGGPLVPSPTAAIPLVGAGSLDAARAELSVSGLDPRVSERLLDRYGAVAVDVGRRTHRDPALAGTLPGAKPYLGAEVAYAVESEGALHLEDVLARRTRISFEAPDGGRAAAPAAAAIMAPLLGWTDGQAGEEVERYWRWLDTERAFS